MSEPVFTKPKVLTTIIFNDKNNGSLNFALSLLEKKIANNEKMSGREEPMESNVKLSQEHTTGICFCYDFISYPDALCKIYFFCNFVYVFPS